MQNILIFIDWFLPGTKAGGPVRSMANLTDHLSDSFKFWIVTRNTDYCETSPYPNITSDKWVLLKPNINVYYVSESENIHKVFTKFLKNELFNVVYINGIYSPKFSITPLRIAKKYKKKIIVAPRGMLNSQAFSVKPWRKKVFIGIAKILGWYRNITFHATNTGEKKFIQKAIGSGSKIKIAPNLPRKILGTPKEKQKNSGALTLVNIARISPEKGTLHMLTYLNALKTEAKIQLDIFGPIYNQSYWDECLKKINDLPSNITVDYHGALDGEKVPSTVQQYHFFFMPSEGENFGHSILEALSMGTPVIISNNTPWQNLADKNVGWDISIPNTRGFTEALTTAIKMDQKTYDKWSQNSFNLAKSFCEDVELIHQSTSLFI